MLAAGDHDAVLLALGSLGPAAFVRGRFTEAEGEAALRRSAALARAEQSPARLRFGLTVLAASLLLEGRLEDARGALQEAEAAAHGFSDPLVPYMAAQLAWEAGELPRVADDGLRVAALLSPMRLAWMLTLVVLATAELGDLGTARRYLDLSGELLGGRRMWTTSDQHIRAAGRLALAEGGAARAVTTLDAAATAQLDTDALPLAVRVLADLAEAAMLARRPDVAHRRRGQRGRGGPADRPRPPSWPGGAGRRLCRAGRRRPRRGDRAGPGGAAPAGRAWPPLAGGWRQRAAGPCPHRCRPQRGDSATRACRRPVRGVRRPLAPPPDPDAAAAAGKPGQRAAAATLGAGSLTDREQEVVALAVEGLTARAIGQRLHIGERRVETHLAHAYAKLGVRSRWELARLPPP